MPPRLRGSDWFTQGLEILKRTYRVLQTGVRQTLAEAYYRVGNRNHTLAHPHPNRINVGPTTTVPTTTPENVEVRYNFNNFMNGEILVHHWSVTECSFEDVRPRMIYLLT
jgi:hypothetical protein